MVSLQDKIKQLLIDHTSAPTDVCEWLAEEIDIVCHQDMIARHFGVDQDGMDWNFVTEDMSKYFEATKELKDEE
jgi:hypothetical protein